MSVDSSSSPRRLIICCDGTWNSPGKGVQRLGEREQCTNVVKTVRSIAPLDEHGQDQIVYYDSGVGTAGLFDKYVGGFTGHGIRENIEQAYRFLANNYRDGDEIWCFGFSRGAYTVRSLGGLINTVGLLPKGSLKFFPLFYNYYRTAKSRRKDLPEYDEITSIIGTNRKPPITFMGVWDTVGALGAPTPLLGRITRSWVGFHDTRAGNIQYAYHALAVDELRKPFAPSVWTEKDDVCKVMKQVWFAGAHSNVGGGYLDCGLSDGALIWMMNNATRHGLRLLDDWMEQADRIQANPDAEIVHSYKLMYRIFGAIFRWRYPRPIGGKHRDVNGTRVSGCEEFVHDSLHWRARKNKHTVNPRNLAYGIEHLPVDKP
ncbi:DUF2235 domain-containing protein [bacterium]|nr:DUF2235 domain-containing protein [bacterium]